MSSTGRDRHPNDEGRDETRPQSQPGRASGNPSRSDDQISYSLSTVVDVTRADNLLWSAWQEPTW